MSRRDRTVDRLHHHHCRCDACTPRARTAAQLAPAERASFMAIAGVAIGLALCEAYALIAHAPHVTVLFGGNG